MNETPSTARTTPRCGRRFTGKCFCRSLRDQHRLRRAAAVARIAQWRRMATVIAHHSRTSMAARRPSLTRLKQIEVTKIADPGSAQTSGLT